jgi:muramoyltetrapeptide carboxypeptidase LdcA involved in peptidoglycan recycling
VRHRTDRRNGTDYGSRRDFDMRPTRLTGGTRPAHGFGGVSPAERREADLFAADLLGRSPLRRRELPPPAEHQVAGAPALTAGAVGPAVDGRVNLAHLALVAPSGALTQPGTQQAQINALTPRFVASFRGAGHGVALDLAPNEPSAAFRDEADYPLAGTDAQRWDALSWALFDPATVAVLATRGGHGATRLLDELAAAVAIRRVVRGAARLFGAGAQPLFPPKRIVGFSDFTAILLAAYNLLGWAGIHGPMLCCSDAAERTRLIEILTRAPAALYPAGNLVQGNLNLVGNRPGPSIRGVMLGGNLSLVDALYGSPFFPSLQDGLLFVEETGEEGRKIDRMIEGLKQRGAAAQARGVVVGHCASIRPRAAATLFQRSWNVPCVYELNAGHGGPNLALWLGLEYELRFPAAGGASLFLVP